MSSGRLPLDSRYRKVSYQRHLRDSARIKIEPSVAWAKRNANWIMVGQRKITFQFSPVSKHISFTRFTTTDLHSPRPSEIFLKVDRLDSMHEYDTVMAGCVSFVVDVVVV